MVRVVRSSVSVRFKARAATAPSLFVQLLIRDNCFESSDGK